MNKAPYTPHNHGNPPFVLLLVVSYYPSVGHQSLIETLGYNSYCASLPYIHSYFLVIEWLNYPFPGIVSKQVHNNGCSFH